MGALSFTPIPVLITGRTGLVHVADIAALYRQGAARRGVLKRQGIVRCPGNPC
jgi:hypothetical protein